MQQQEELINDILDRELKMFLTVPTMQKASCQEDPDSFKKIRRSHFMTWGRKTLNSYLEDLKEAEKDGRNLMRDKYARMDNLIPKLYDGPLIDQIVEIELKWQKYMFEQYPNLMGGARPLTSDQDTPFSTSFETYLKGELESYSEKTLSCLYDDVKNAFEKGENVTEKLYVNMVKQMGYSSIDDAEAVAKKRK